MQLKMSFSMEKVLADAQELSNRLKEHDSAADNLIAVTQTMYRRVDSMRQYQEDLNELNEIARHRPRSNLILGLMQENSQIRELQQENKELRGCLEEHQSALELIMSKYREQIFKLMMANKMDRKSTDHTDGSEEVGDKLEKICEMAAIMQKAIRIDETEAMRNREHLAQLETENKTLRELLLISYQASREVSKMDRSVQANIVPPVASLDSSGNHDTESQGATTDDEEHHFLANDMNASVIENKSFTFGAPDKASSPVSTWGRDTTGSLGSDVSSHNDSSSSEDKISLQDVAVTVTSGSQSNVDQGTGNMGDSVNSSEDKHLKNPKDMKSVNAESVTSKGKLSSKEEVGERKEEMNGSSSSVTSQNTDSSSSC